MFFRDFFNRKTRGLYEAVSIIEKSPQEKQILGLKDFKVVHLHHSFGNSHTPTQQDRTLGGDTSLVLRVAFEYFLCHT